LAPRLQSAYGMKTRILVADDSGVARGILKFHLNAWGYDVVTAANGDDAWRVLDAPNPPAIALLDWMMPGRDGLELCRTLRKNGRAPYTYVILLTGKTGQEDIVCGLAAGADDYLKKPFDKGELEARLGTACRILSELATAGTRTVKRAPGAGITASAA
jgi:two-component system, cell cycle response regulator